MSPVAQVVSPDVVLVATSGVAVVLALAVALVLHRVARRRRRALDEELMRSRDEVESLSRKLDELAGEVARTQHTAELDREYVITSLGSVTEAELVSRPADGVPTRREGQPVVEALENQLVDALARRSRASLVGSRGTELVVRAVALGHGVRRALSADVLDRAAAEAHVARRRSRRHRRRDVREARRVRAAGQGQEVA